MVAPDGLVPRAASRAELALAEAESNAHRAEQRLREAIEALPEGIVFLDAEGRYILWNQKYAEIYHASADLFCEGVRLIDTLRVGVARGDYPEAVGREEEWLAERMALLDNPGHRHQQLLADGRWVMIEERQTSEGGVIGLRVDITDMKHQAQALESALKQAEDAAKAKNEFLANMSHEIRTPLNGVLGLADVLSRSDLDASQRDLVQTIIASAGALNHLLSDLLDFSRLEVGRIDLAKEPFDLAELAAQTAALFEPQARHKGLTFNLRIDAAAHHRVVGDEARLRQILVNLLSNAVKFTASGSIDMTVAASGLGDRYHFEVRDSGIGFEPEYAERLFGRFEQADGSITRKYGGTGLGLAISRQLAELMGGSISAAGQPGRGAVFTLDAAACRGPRRPSPNPVAEDRRRPDAGRAAHPGGRRQRHQPQGRRADSRRGRRRGGQRRKRPRGGRGGPGRAVSRDPDGPPDARDGRPDRHALDPRAARRPAVLARTPIIVLSANVMPEHLQASAEAGADDHIGKPIRGLMAPSSGRCRPSPAPSAGPARRPRSRLRPDRGPYGHLRLR